MALDDEYYRKLNESNQRFYRTINEIRMGMAPAEVPFWGPKESTSEMSPKESAISKDNSAGFNKSAQVENSLKNGVGQQIEPTMSAIQEDSLLGNHFNWCIYKKLNDIRIQIGVSPFCYGCDFDKDLGHYEGCIRRNLYNGYPIDGRLSEIATPSQVGEVNDPKSPPFEAPMVDFSSVDVCEIVVPVQDTPVIAPDTSKTGLLPQYHHLEVDMLTSLTRDMVDDVSEVRSDVISVVASEEFGVMIANLIEPIGDRLGDSVVSLTEFGKFCSAHQVFDRLSGHGVFEFETNKRTHDNKSSIVIDLLVDKLWMRIPILVFDPGSDGRHEFLSGDRTIVVMVSIQNETIVVIRRFVDHENWVFDPGGVLFHDGSHCLFVVAAKNKGVLLKQVLADSCV